MKQIILIVFLVSITIKEISAQSTRRTLGPVYCSIGLGLSHPHTWRRSVEVEIKHGYSATFYALFRNRDAINLPSDWYNSFFSSITNGGSLEERLKVLGLTAGKAWWMGENSLTRFHLKGGLTFNRLTHPINFRPPAPRFINFVNYDNDWETLRYTGFVFQPSLELALSRFFSLSVSWYTNQNKYRSFSGFEAALKVGHLRGKRSGPTVE